MRMEQRHTLDDLKHLTREEFHKYWFIDALSDKEMADIFGTTKQEVRKRRKELNLTYMNSAMLYIAGGAKFKSKATPRKEYRLKKKTSKGEN